MKEFGCQRDVLVRSGEGMEGHLVEEVLNGIRVEGGVLVDDVTPVGVPKDVFRGLLDGGGGGVGVDEAGFSELPIEGHERVLIVLGWSVAEEA